MAMKGRMGYTHFMKYYFNENGWAVTTCINIDESHKHDVDWEKQLAEGKRGSVTPFL